MAEMTVILSWVPHAKGGRKTPPVPPAGRSDYWYSTLARFDVDPQWKKGAWSLVVLPTQVWNNGHFWIATANFLSEDAPPDLLTPGARFDLMEGDRVVVHGMVADPTRTSDLSPDSIEDVLLV